MTGRAGGCGGRHLIVNQVVVLEEVICSPAIAVLHFIMQELCSGCEDLYGDYYCLEIKQPYWPACSVHATGVIRQLTIALSHEPENLTPSS